MDRRGLTVAAMTAGIVLVISTVLYGRNNTDALNQPASASPNAARDFKAYAAPRFTGTTLDGQHVSLADYRGKTVVVNFFADWCTPCAKEAPELSSFASTLGPDTVMLSVARESDRSGARAFAKRHAMDWTVLFDRSDALTQAFRLVGQPATFVIDRRGRIVFAKLGPVTEKMLAGAVSRA
jgi:cytochrome c biogenesis protein CcmG, thiol:disulfide interchange protein DsbE